VAEPREQQVQAYPSCNPALNAPQQRRSHAILGLGRSPFWPCLLLIAGVVIMAVGGGVSGSLAVKEREVSDLITSIHKKRMQRNQRSKKKPTDREQIPKLRIMQQLQGHPR
jgi:hypothetical protein